MEIIKILCRRRKERMCNLAAEFGVSIKTIQRDIDEIGFLIPIRVKRGRYYGGVYIKEDYSFDRAYMSDEELKLMRKLLDFIVPDSNFGFTEKEIEILRKIIRDYTCPR